MFYFKLKQQLKSFKLKRLPTDELAVRRSRLEQYMDLRPVVKKDTRHRLIYSAGPWQLSRLLTVRPMPILATLVVTLGLFGGTALASQQSLPPDLLYPVKIATEQVKLALTPSVEGKIKAHLGFAERRLAETKKLAAQGDTSAIALPTLAYYEAEIQSATNLLLQTSRNDVGDTVKPMAGGQTVLSALNISNRAIVSEVRQKLARQQDELSALVATGVVLSDKEQSGEIDKEKNILQKRALAVLKTVNDQENLILRQYVVNPLLTSGVGKNENLTDKSAVVSGGQSSISSDNNQAGESSAAVKPVPLGQINVVTISRAEVEKKISLVNAKLAELSQANELIRQSANWKVETKSDKNFAFESGKADEILTQVTELINKASNILASDKQDVASSNYVAAYRYANQAYSLLLEAESLINYNVNPTLTRIDFLCDFYGGGCAKEVLVPAPSPRSVNSAPHIVLYPSSPIVIAVNDNLPVKFSAADADNDALTWIVDWNEGNEPVIQRTFCTTTEGNNPAYRCGWEFNAVHGWPRPGDYMVKVTVEDGKGGSDTYKFTVSVRLLQ